MNTQRTTTAIASMLAALLLLPACNPEDADSGDPKATITRDDIVDIDDLLVEDAADAGAVKVGETAWLLGEARMHARNATAHIRSVLHKIKITLKHRAPDATGVTVFDQPFGVWNGSDNGVDYRLLATRVTGRRVRYALYGRKPGGDFKGLLTGVFVKRAPRRGGGRLHLNLGNMSALTGAPGHTGMVHVWFANHRAGVKARRVVYRNVKPIDGSKPAVHFGIDLLHRKVAGKSVGGRLRVIGVDDIVPESPGTEVAAIRVLWKTGVGGRADAFVARIKPLPWKTLGHMHECWDAKGLRTAYADNIPGNEADNPNQGDVTACFGMQSSDVPEATANLDGNDFDPEVDLLLGEAEADVIDEGEAAQTTTPQLQ